MPNGNRCFLFIGRTKAQLILAAQIYCFGSDCAFRSQYAIAGTLALCETQLNELLTTHLSLRRR